MTARPKTTSAAWLARLILAVSSLGWLLLLALEVRGYQPSGLVVVLKHGAEGALVGALCDWFAVSQVYREARKNFGELVSGVSRAVVRDMVKPGMLLQRPAASLRKLLEEPASVEAIGAWAKRRLPAREVLARWLREAWRTGGRPGLVDRLVGLDLRAVVVGADLRGGLAESRALRQVVQACLRESLQHPARLAELRELICRMGRGVTVGSALGIRSSAEMRRVLDATYDAHVREHLIAWLAEADLRGGLRGAGGGTLLSTRQIREVLAHGLRHVADDAEVTGRASRLAMEIAEASIFPELPVPAALLKLVTKPKFTPAKLGEYLKRGAESIARPPKGGDSEAFRLACDAAISYLDAWHALSRAERLAAATAIHDALKPLLVEGASNALWAALAEEPLEDLLRAFVTEEQLTLRMSQLLAWLERPPSGADPAWAEAMRAYAATWLDAWHRLPEGVRRLAASELVSAFEAPILEFAGETAWKAREELVAASWEGRLTRLAWVSELLDLLDRLEVPPPKEIDAAVEKLLAEHLGKGGPEEFVAVLEVHTRARLDMIQLSGAGLGLGLGLVAGVLNAVVRLEAAG